MDVDDLERTSTWEATSSVLSAGVEDTFGRFSVVLGGTPVEMLFAGALLLVFSLVLSLKVLYSAVVSLDALLLDAVSFVTVSFKALCLVILSLVTVWLVVASEGFREVSVRIDPRFQSFILWGINLPK